MDSETMNAVRRTVCGFTLNHNTWMFADSSGWVPKDNSLFLCHTIHRHFGGSVPEDMKVRHFEVNYSQDIICPFQLLPLRAGQRIPAQTNPIGLIFMDHKQGKVLDIRDGIDNIAGGEVLLRDQAEEKAGSVKDGRTRSRHQG